MHYKHGMHVIIKRGKYVMVKKISEKTNPPHQCWHLKLPTFLLVLHTEMCSTVVFHTCMECVFLIFTPITFLAPPSLLLVPSSPHKFPSTSCLCETQ